MSVAFPSAPHPTRRPAALAASPVFRDACTAETTQSRSRRGVAEAVQDIVLWSLRAHQPDTLLRAIQNGVCGSVGLIASSLTPKRICICVSITFRFLACMRRPARLCTPHQDELALGAAHPCEGLGFVMGLTWLFYNIRSPSRRQRNQHRSVTKRRLARHVLVVAVETEFGIDLHPGC